MSVDATREELDARLVRDVRQWRDNPSVSLKLRQVGSATLDLEELDALLRTIDRLERLKRELIDMPDDDDGGGFKPIRVDTLPAGRTLIGDDVPLPAPFAPTEPAS